MHLESQRTDILALQETRVENKSAEHHEDYVVYFSTSVNQGQKNIAWRLTATNKTKLDVRLCQKSNSIILKNNEFCW